ncbi:MAG TPA: NAD(P)H-dependent oxidoreductase [Gammaproteobacteria bacterium]|nr:NAD(P)H-dependent oxidoreductase [Gammaproteobacteria bacterium]
MAENQVKTILRVDSSSARHESVTRRLGDEVIRRLRIANQGASLVVRDVSRGLEFLSESWVQANQTSPVERTRQQQAVLSGSDQLVRELDSADLIVITAPVYNFSVPAALKAWIDLVCRARLTFHYTENGPEGLLKDRPVYLVMASGGVAFGSASDYASGYIRHILDFIGIHDVRLVYAEKTNANGTASESAALTMLESWLPLDTTIGVA